MKELCHRCKIVEIDDPVYCCDGWMCGCQGKSIEPPLCFDCYDIVINGSPQAIKATESPSEAAAES